MKCLELSRGEAFGYAWDGVARGMTIVSAIFMQIALLEVAERKAVNEELDVLGLAFKPVSRCGCSWCVRVIVGESVDHINPNSVSKVTTSLTLPSS